MNELYLKSQIFDLFENARILFNEYYNGKEEYTKEDLENILKLMLSIEDNTYEIENEIGEVI